MKLGFQKYMLMNEAGAEGGDGGGGSLLGGGDGAAAPADAGVIAGDSSVGGGGTGVSFPENWKEGLPEDIRNEAMFANVPDIPTLAKNYINAQKAMGKKGVHLPDEHSTDEDRRSFFQQLGLPASLETYELSTPEDAGFEDGFLSQFREIAYQSNILPEQANAILKWYSEANNQAVNSMMENEKLNQQKELNELKQQWGQEYDRRLQLARSVLKSANLEDVNTWLDQSGMGNNVMLLKLLSSVGNIMKEDGVLDTGDNIGPSNDSIQKRIQELEGNTKGPLYDKYHPNHGAAVKERDELYKQLYPGQ